MVLARPQVQNEDGKALKSIGAMTSDIGQWSLNLLKKLKPAPSADKATDKSETPEPKDNKELQKTEGKVWLIDFFFQFPYLLLQIVNLTMQIWWARKQ